MRGGVGAFAYRHARIVKQYSPSAGEIYFGMFQQKADLLFEAQWIRDIVGVHARHVISSGTLDTLVEARSQFEASPVAPDQYARIMKRTRQRTARIRGSVIAQQELP